MASGGRLLCRAGKAPPQPPLIGKRKRLQQDKAHRSLLKNQTTFKRKRLQRDKAHRSLLKNQTTFKRKRLQRDKAHPNYG